MFINDEMRADISLLLKRLKSGEEIRLSQIRKAHKFLDDKPIEALTKELRKELDNYIRNSVRLPICPYCNSEMFPQEYTTYYCEFHVWECECDELPFVKSSHLGY